jgi:aminoglycoside N3'-acetyltransferase
MLTQSDIETGLRNLSVQPGMMLEVHSSLRAFGYVQGGAETVIAALQNTVGPQGAVVMPAFRLSRKLPLTQEDTALGITLKIRYLREGETSSDMGLIADTFRQMSDVCEGEGHFRVAAWGNDANVHAHAGFQHIINHGGYALLLGVNIYRLSAMHYVEEAMPAAVKARFAPSAEARAHYPADEWFIESFAPAAKPWYEIQAQAYAAGLITEGMIGDCKCMFFPVKPVVELYRQALLTRPYELFGLAS